MATFLDGAVYNPRLNSISLKVDENDPELNQFQKHQQQQQTHTIDYSITRSFIEPTQTSKIIEVQHDLTLPIQNNSAKPRIPPPRGRKPQNNDLETQIPNQQAHAPELDQQQMKEVRQINGLSVADQVKSCFLGILMASVKSVQNSVVNAGKLISRAGGQVYHALISVAQSIRSRILTVTNLVKVFVIALNPVKTVGNYILNQYKMIRRKFGRAVLAENNAAIIMNQIKTAPFTENKQLSLSNRTQKLFRLIDDSYKLINKQKGASQYKLIDLRSDLKGKQKSGELIALPSANIQILVPSRLDHKADPRIIQFLQASRTDLKNDLSVLSDAGTNQLAIIEKASGLPVVSGAFNSVYTGENLGLVPIAQSQKQENPGIVDAEILQKQKKHSIQKANIRYYKRENLVMKQPIVENNHNKVEGILMELPEVAGEIYMHITNNNLVKYEMALDDILRADNYDLEIAEITKVVIKVTLQILKVRNEVDAYEPTKCKLEFSREQYNSAK